MITRICRALMMMTAMTMVSTTLAEAQRVTGETLRELSQGSEGRTSAAVSGRAHESHAAIDQLAGPGLALGLGERQEAIVGSWLDTRDCHRWADIRLALHLRQRRDLCLQRSGDAWSRTRPFPHVFSAGHGVWVHRRGRTFSQTAIQLISDLEGTYCSGIGSGALSPSIRREMPTPPCGRRNSPTPREPGASPSKGRRRAGASGPHHYRRPRRGGGRRIRSSSCLMPPWLTAPARSRSSRVAGARGP